MPTFTTTMTTIDKVHVGQNFKYEGHIYVKTTNSMTGLLCRGVALTGGNFEDITQTTLLGHIYSLPANGPCSVEAGYNDLKDTIDELYKQNMGNDEYPTLLKLLLLHPEFKHPMEDS